MSATMERRLGRLLRGPCAIWLACCAAWTWTFSTVAAPRTELSRQALHTSKYKGVTWHDRHQRWQVHVDDPDRQEIVSLGFFSSEKDAAEAYDCCMISIEGPDAAVNLPFKRYSKDDIEKFAVALSDFWRPRPSARFWGVYQTFNSKKWRAEIEIYGVKQFIGSFDDEEEAGRAVDAALRSTGAEKALQLQILNFCTDTDYFDDDTWEEESVPRGASSRFMGVTYHQPSGQFLARLGRRHLGLYDEEDDAARAFDEASHARGGRTNFHPSNRRP
mmetsp:Transcript_3076/g.5409  ORF Transcript_3076/g.5409 Transcript_3076/m.5409 type:complete len:274 (+) Transcript_3076:74-895(+)